MMKRTEAERLYHKYTMIGAKVHFAFNSAGGVDAVQIEGNSWRIRVTDKDVLISGNLTFLEAEPIIDLLLIGKGE
jgi:hypothetical protein